MPNMTRTGLITKKLGMTRIFDADGKHVPVTVLHVQDATVMEQRTAAKDGYTALQVGAFSKKAQRVRKPELGHFTKTNTAPKAKVMEFRVTEENLLAAGTELKADHFVAGQKVDVELPWFAGHPRGEHPAPECRVDRPTAGPGPGV
jgi:large subunit ribosomal protein L3